MGQPEGRLHLRLDFFRQLQRLSFGFHDKIHSGDLITRGMLDLEGARAFIQGAMVPALSLILLLGFAAWMMLAADPAMAAIGLAFVPIAGVVAGPDGLPAAGHLAAGAAADVDPDPDHGGEPAGHPRGPRLRRPRLRAGQVRRRRQRGAGLFQYRRITLRFRGVAGCSSASTPRMAALLWYGGDKVLAGRMTAGGLTEFVIYMTLLQAPIRQIAMIFNSAARATSSGGRLFEVLDLEPEIADAPGARR